MPDGPGRVSAPQDKAARLSGSVRKKRGTPCRKTNQRVCREVLERNGGHEGDEKNRRPFMSPPETVPRLAGSQLFSCYRVQPQENGGLEWGTPCRKTNQRVCREVFERNGGHEGDEKNRRPFMSPLKLSPDSQVPSYLLVIAFSHKRMGDGNGDTMPQDKPARLPGSVRKKRGTRTLKGLHVPQLGRPNRRPTNPAPQLRPSNLHVHGSARITTLPSRPRNWGSEW